MPTGRVPKLLNNPRSEEIISEDENDIDVVIVGAGLGGLVCAYNILKKSSGLEVLIIEEKSEVGGRLLPQESSETYYATLAQKHVDRLVEDLNLNTISGRNVDNKKRVLYTKKGRTQSFSSFTGAEVYSFLQRLQESTTDLMLDVYKKHCYTKTLAEMNVEQLLCLLVYFPEPRALCRPFISAVCGMRDLKDISALWFLTMLNGAGGFFNRLKFSFGDNNRYYVQGGMLQLAKELLAEILLAHGKIVYDEQVSKIRYNDDRVYISTQKNRIKCDVVVIAVGPPQHNRIEIQPPLTSSFQSEHYLPGRNTFFNITYEQPFWNENYTGNILTTEDSKSKLHFCYDVSKSYNGIQKFTLAGYLHGSTETKTLFETLNECFGSNEAAHYVTYKEFESSRYDGAGVPMSVMKPGPVGFPVNYTNSPYNRYSNKLT